MTSLVMNFKEIKIKLTKDKLKNDDKPTVYHRIKMFYNPTFRPINNGWLLPTKYDRKYFTYFPVIEVKECPFRLNTGLEMHLFNCRIIPITLVSLIIAACSGGSGEGSEQPSQVSGYSENLEEYQRYIDNGAALNAELPLATTESLFQISSMASAHIDIASDLMVEQSCTGNELGNGQGTLSLNSSSSPHVSGTTIEVNLDNCYDPYLLGIANGTYIIVIDKLTETDTEFTLQTSGLRIFSGESETDIGGSLKVSTTQSISKFITTILSVNSGLFTLDIQLEEDTFTETLTNINLSRELDFSKAEYTISGSFNEASELLDQSLEANFSVPMTGFIGHFPSSGSFDVSAQGLAVRINVNNESNFGHYQVGLDVNNSSEFFMPSGVDATSYSFYDALYTVLFLEPTPFYSENAISLLSANDESLAVISLTGYTSKPEGNTLGVSSGSTLSFRFNRPVSFTDDDLEPIIYLISSINDPFSEEEPANYILNGAFLTIELPEQLTPGQTYSLDFSTSYESSRYHFQTYFYEANQLNIEVTSPLFAFAGESFELEAKVHLAEGAVLDRVEWFQISGPDIDLAIQGSAESLIMPATSLDYEEIEIEVKAFSSTETQSTERFKFLLVSPNLNRHIAYFPFTQSGSNVFLGDANAITSEVLEDRYALTMDTLNGPIRYGIHFAALPEGDSTIGLSENASWWVDTGLLPLHSDPDCERGAPIGLDEEQRTKLHGFDTRLNDGLIANTSFKINNYCRNLGETQTYLGLLIQEGVFTYTTPGFLFENTSVPLTISSAEFENLSVSIEPNDHLVISEDYDSLNVNSIPSTQTALLTISHDAGERSFIEAEEIELIKELDDQIHIYFEKKVHASPSQNYVFSQFVELEEIDIEHNFFNRIDVTLDSSPDIITLGFYISYLSELPPLGEKVEILRNGDSTYAASVTFNSVVCTSDSWFILHDYEADSGGNITKLAADVYQSCSGYDGEQRYETGYDRMSIRYNSASPIVF